MSIGKKAIPQEINFLTLRSPAGTFQKYVCKVRQIFFLSFLFANVSWDENYIQCDAHQLNTSVPPLDINAQQKFGTKDGRRNESLSRMSNGPRWRQNQCLGILSDSFLESMCPNRGTKRDTSLSSFPVSKK